MGKITKIVITGGPCAGKTASFQWIRETFSREGYRVLTVAETATELISGGIAPWSCCSKNEYQKCQMTLQVAKEDVYIRAACGMSDENVLIVCDRGLPDNKVYMDEEEFYVALDEMGISEEEMYHRYDGVFHLMTAAKGALDFYSSDSNPVRMETPEEAAALDDAQIAVWDRHPYRVMIDNSTEFPQKMERLMDEIRSFLS